MVTVTLRKPRALHINHIRPAPGCHTGRLRWLVWPQRSAVTAASSAGEGMAMATFMDVHSGFTGVTADQLRQQSG